MPTINHPNTSDLSESLTNAKSAMFKETPELTIANSLNTTQWDYQATGYMPSINAKTTLTDWIDHYSVGRDEWAYNLNADDICKENGFNLIIEGFYRSIPVTYEESEIVKIWENSNESIEEFFVLGAIHGNIDLNTMIVLSEVSLRHLANKTIGDLLYMEGMSKNFFKIIEYTDYLDDLILDSQFIRYWLGRRQDLLNSKPTAARLVAYMLHLLQMKKKNV
jgi:hypothetical protein